MANRNKKIAPKDVEDVDVEENLQPTPIPVYPMPSYRKKNLGIKRAEKEQKRREKEEYPGVRNVIKRENRA